MRKPTFVLVISDPGWSDSIASIHASETAARKALVRFIRTNWEALTEEPMDPAANPESLMDTIFGGGPGDPYYEILGVG